MVTYLETRDLCWQTIFLFGSARISGSIYQANISYVLDTSGSDFGGGQHCFMPGTNYGEIWMGTRFGCTD